MKKENCRVGEKAPPPHFFDIYKNGPGVPNTLHNTTVSNKQTGPNNQPEQNNIEPEAQYLELENIIRDGFPTYVEVNARSDKYMRPFTPEEIQTENKVSTALFLMEMREYYRLEGYDSVVDWLITIPFCLPPQKVQAYLCRVLDDSDLVLLAWHMAFKKAGNYYPTKRQLKSTVKEVNRSIPMWLKEGEACQKASREGVDSESVEVTVDIIK